MRTASDKRWGFTAHIVMIVLTILALAPFVLLVIASFTDEGAAIRNGYTYIPEKWSLDAYKYILSQWGTIGRSYLVTIFVTTAGTLASVIMSGMLAYVLSRKELPGRSFLLFALTFTMLFNGGMTSTYIIYTQLFHIKNTIFGLLVPGLLMNAFNVMMFRNYFETSIPGALMEAARIDGASETKIFFKVVVPLSMPMVATVGLTVALMYWNDWTNGLYYLSQDSKLQSIQTLLNNMNENIKYLQQNNINTEAFSGAIPSTTIRMAIAVVGIVPILILYPFFQKWFVKGMMSGAIKE